MITFYIVLIVAFLFKLEAIPSITKSTVFDAEVTVLSYALWSHKDEYNDGFPPWITSILDFNSSDIGNGECIITIAIVGMHTHKAGHKYDICSNGNPQMFPFHPRRYIADASPWIRRGISNLSPVLILREEKDKEVFCSFYSWTRGVLYVACQLTEHTCQSVREKSVQMSMRSAYNVEKRCQNPIVLDFTLQVKIVCPYCPLQISANPLTLLSLSRTDTELHPLWQFHYVCIQVI